MTRTKLSFLMTSSVDEYLKKKAIRILAEQSLSNLPGSSPLAVAKRRFAKPPPGKWRNADLLLIVEPDLIT